MTGPVTIARGHSHAAHGGRGVRRPRVRGAGASAGAGGRDQDGSLPRHHRRGRGDHGRGRPRLGIRTAIASALSAAAVTRLRRERVRVHNLKRAGEAHAISAALSTGTDRSFVTFNGVNAVLEPRLLRALATPHATPRAPGALSVGPPRLDAPREAPAPHRRHRVVGLRLERVPGRARGAAGADGRAGLRVPQRARGAALRAASTRSTTRIPCCARAARP